MMAILRVVGAIIAGFLTAFALVVAVELFSAVVHPVPEGFTGTQEEMCLHVENYPHWVLAVVVPMWGFTAFLGTWIAGRLGNLFSAIFLAVLLLAAVLFNIAMLPYPLWFKLVQPAVILAAVLLACRWSNRPRSVAKAE